MSLPSKEISNPSSMDISNSMVFTTHNSSLFKPKDKRKPSPSKNQQASHSPSSISPSYAKTLVIHQNIDKEVHASTANANLSSRHQDKVVKVWKQVGLPGPDSSKSHVIHQPSSTLEFDNSLNKEQKSSNSHNILVEKLQVVLNGSKENSKDDNI